MAIDSRAKRMSIPGVARPYMRAQDNDAAAGQAWRQSAGNIYAGISVEAPGGFDEELLVIGSNMRGGLAGPRGGMLT